MRALVIVMAAQATSHKVKYEAQEAEVCVCKGHSVKSLEKVNVVKTVHSWNQLQHHYDILARQGLIY